MQSKQQNIFTGGHDPAMELRNFKRERVAFAAVWESIFSLRIVFNNHMKENFAGCFANPISLLPQAWNMGVIPQLAFFSCHLKAIL